MKQISIQIPDSQFSFMMELLEKFSFVKFDHLEKTPNFTLTPMQKNAIEEERIKCKNDPDYALNWDEIKDTFKFD